MTRFTRMTRGLLAAAFCILSGCATVPNTHYYTFRPTLSASLQGDEATRSPFSLSVEGYGGDVPYQQDKIVFRISAYEINFYEYHRWLRPPTELVTEQVLKQAGASGLFRSVVVEGDFDASTRYVLDGRVLMFDQWYTEQNRSTVRVGIRYRFFAPEQEQDLLLDKIIETTADTPSMEILEVIKAFETALHENITQAIAEIDRIIVQHTE